MSSIVNVDISLTHQYKIYIDQHLEKQFTAFCRDRYNPEKIIIVIDSRVNRLHGERIKKMCRSCFENTYFIEIPEGEASKSVSEWSDVVTRVLTIGVERNTPLLAAGGGVAGDLGGFVAASVLRGLPLIHLPTSLLAMVDSSIGGKTGVNHKTGKNLIGAFYQPDAVFADVSFLETLSGKEWITGLAEILKYAAIRKPALFEELTKLTDMKLAPSGRWEDIIAESARIKADFVQKDTLEAGLRAFLNFGHTFGHALEKVAGYGTISHGEAVFAGMLAATHFSNKLGHPVEAARFEPFLPLYQEQVQALPYNIDQLIVTMKSDKKVKSKKQRLVLLKEWGSPYIYECTNRSELYDAWEYALKQFN